VIGEFFQDNLIEILLGIILLFNVSAVKVIWKEIKKEKNEREKNTESMNMVLNRIFGIDQDPTDEGHLVETQEQFEELSDKLDSIAESQEKARKERKEEHEEVRSSINYIMEELSKEEKYDFEGRKL
jgi:F0F1-type ATP synthase membrane subunit b/b'